MINIKSAEFITGAVDKKQFPSSSLPEIVFAGRSNVGKSSLINSLLGRRSLARVGNTPGKTREINFFLVNEAFRFVDLPGFGYAKVAGKELDRWKSYIETYFSSGRHIKMVVHVIDARHPGLDNDLTMADFLKASGLPGCIVAGKADKLKQNERLKSVRRITEIFGQEPVLYSALKKSGRTELWNVLEAALKNSNSGLA
ncbi:MAG: ribosome biogenesis GTP-binding protein YihA/YsxC [Victivallales bacterium]|nr:ribosome biogenesis GTP-binding protein YihA/YsxC [Victivallales bacterium]